MSAAPNAQEIQLDDQHSTKAQHLARQATNPGLVKRIGAWFRSLPIRMLNFLVALPSDPEGDLYSAPPAYPLIGSRMGEPRYWRGKYF